MAMPARAPDPITPEEELAELVNEIIQDALETLEREVKRFYAEAKPVSYPQSSGRLTLTPGAWEFLSTHNDV